MNEFKINGNQVYRRCETGDWLLCGKVIKGVDNYYIEWYA